MIHKAKNNRKDKTVSVIDKTFIRNLQVEMLWDLQTLVQTPLQMRSLICHPWKSTQDIRYQ